MQLQKSHSCLQRSFRSTLLFVVFGRRELLIFATFITEVPPPLATSKSPVHDVTSHSQALPFSKHPGGAILYRLGSSRGFSVGPRTL